MQRIGRLNGTGTVGVAGNSFDAVDYAIDIWQEGGGGSKSATGHLAGSPTALFAAFDAGSATLALADGGEVQFIVTSLSVNGAAIRISGPVPGY